MICAKLFILLGFCCWVVFAITHVSKEYLELCGANWQNEYAALHRAIMNGEKEQKYVVAFPIKAGLADMIHGYISAFLWALLSDRAFLILRVPQLDDNTQRTIDFAYKSPYINWASPYISREVFACLLPPYDGSNRVQCQEQNIPFNGHQRSITHVGGVNGGFTTDYDKASTDLKTLRGDKDILMTISNRGATYRIFDHPEYGPLLTSRFNMTRQTAFPCLFHFLFQPYLEVCQGSCRDVYKQLRHAGKSGQVVRIAIHVRNPQWGAGEHFHCADSLVNHYQAQGKEVLVVLVATSASLQRQAKDKYGDKLLLPAGEPVEASAVHDRPQHLSLEEEQAFDRQATMESARDYLIMSQADIHILSPRSGFGVVGAMSRLSYKHIMYHLELTGQMRDCAATPEGDDLSIFAKEWSEL